MKITKLADGIARVLWKMVYRPEAVVSAPPVTAAEQVRRFRAKHPELTAQWANVRDFGAVGDGVTDDSAAVQATVDRVAGLPIAGPTTKDLVESGHLTAAGGWNPARYTKSEHGAPKHQSNAAQLLIQERNAEGEIPPQTCEECHLQYHRNSRECPLCGRASKYLKPKRIRVRAKPLAEADIVAGGVYVPKRGNDKSPNLVVVLIGRARDDAPDRVWWRYTNETDKMAIGPGTPMPEFLALVSRRVTP